jgi:hypothetical protein
MFGLLGRVVLWLVAGPVMLGIAVVRLLVIRAYVGDSMTCTTCSNQISLLNLWECPCSFSFYGWYWSACARCGNRPDFITCAVCGASTLDPAL